MGAEIEIKLRLAEPAALRRRLVELGAELRGTWFEINRLFDTPEKRLFKQDCGLRVRQIWHIDAGGPTSATPAGAERGELTFKGPRSGDAVKSREEINVEVADDAAAALILERLGFHESIRYEKRRQTWSLDPCEVVLDELPRLGWFVEIEAPSGREVEACRAKLGLDGVEPIADTYVGLTEKHGDVTGAGGRALKFPA
ncbi:MAG: class IV adenylate cyclase [Phycisphaerae bacterium]